MSCTDSLVIHLKGGSPWGFTLAGGSDKRQLLTVSKVCCSIFIYKLKFNTYFYFFYVYT